MELLRCSGGLAASCFGGDGPVAREIQIATEFDAKVGTYSSQIEAEIAKAELDACGIEANIMSDNAGGAFPQLECAGVHLFVQEMDAEAAREILSSSAPDVEDAPGDVDEAEETVRRR